MELPKFAVVEPSLGDCVKSQLHRQWEWLLGWTAAIAHVTRVDAKVRDEETAD